MSGNTSYEIIVSDGQMMVGDCLMYNSHLVEGCWIIAQIS